MSRVETAKRRCLIAKLRISHCPYWVCAILVCIYQSDHYHQDGSNIISAKTEKTTIARDLREHGFFVFF